jgi:hypothetical protein
MKTWNCQVKTKENLTTDLMFEEIMQLRIEAATLSSHLHIVCKALKDTNQISPYIKSMVEEALAYQKTLE